MFDLPPPIYNALQKIVHGDYSKERAIINGLRDRRDGTVLEIGCGTGLVSEMFEVGTYVGCDVDDERIDAARKAHPDHEFHVVDFTKDYSSFLERFDTVLFHNCIHHIDDHGMKTTLENIQSAVKKRGRPIDVIAIEPVLPQPVMRNVPGFILAKLDRGRYVRTFDDTTRLFGGNLLKADRLAGPWFWPVPGVAMKVAIT